MAQRHMARLARNGGRRLAAYLPDVMGASLVAILIAGALAVDDRLPSPLTFESFEKEVVQTALNAPAGSQPEESPKLVRALFDETSPSAITLEAEELNRQRRCLAQAIYFEARSEVNSGQIAVAEVVLNRVASAHYPDNICDVVFEGAHRATGCQFSFACDGISDRPRDRVAWLKAMRLAHIIMEGAHKVPVTGASTHYHADYVAPYWANRLVKVVKIGRHIFYRMPGGHQEEG